jgi:hypothetical protein
MHPKYRIRARGIVFLKRAIRVFRCYEELLVIHPQKMYSAPNQGNLFYTWFRTLGLASILVGLGKQSPEKLRYDWQLPRVSSLEMAITR